MSRPFAAFDIDGTIIRWQLYHAIADELASEGHLDPAEYQKVNAAKMKWKRRVGKDSFLDYEQVLVALVNSTITGIEVSAAVKAYSSVINEYKDQVYTYTRDLILELKSKDYLLFAISGSQAEIVKLMAEHYGFDDFGGTTYEIVDNRFTGKNDPLRSTRKPEFLKELVAKHNARWQDSIAIGDSESDIPMLSIVESPVAFNPSSDLFEHAKKEGWDIVLERKNVIYKLQSNDGKYILKNG